ncbi:MAG: mechanosensitive ion channel [Fusobacteriaceae bacterium]|jgi:small conductance mechanosensitive channel|nr:mechanosensitive ion channel [Fusobacteriaceae bacterium]
MNDLKVMENSARSWLSYIFSALPSFLVKVILVVILIFAGRKIIQLICKSFEKIMKIRGTDPLLASFAQSFLKHFLYIVLFFLTIGVLGIRATSLMALLGTAGLAVGLALQGSLSDLAGGVLILIFKPFAKGDYISNTAGVEGVVDQIFILHTILTTADNKNIVVPNGQLAHSTIVNFSQNPVRRLDLTFNVAYDAPVDQVKDILGKVAAEHPLILKLPDRTNTIRLLSLNDSSVSFVFRVWVNNKDYWNVYYDCNETIKKALEENHIEIPYPKLDVYQK